MANYKIVFKQSVAKDLRPIPAKDVQRILNRIDQLADDPRPPGAERLTGDDKYRICQGNYRILYTVGDEIITVTIVKFGHRRDIYRQRNRGRS
jgi:mRNA interferase RelE/StbE